MGTILLHSVDGCGRSRLHSVGALGSDSSHLAHNLGPNSIEKCWLEFWLEKSLEFWLEITHTKKLIKNG